MQNQKSNCELYIYTYVHISRKYLHIRKIIFRSQYVVCLAERDTWTLISEGDSGDDCSTELDDKVSISKLVKQSDGFTGWWIWF